MPHDRREFLRRSGVGFGALALADLLRAEDAGTGTHFPATAKRVIFLFQAGGPSQLDLFDPKPMLVEKHGEELPASVRGEQRLTGMSGAQASLPLVGSPFAFGRHGDGGATVSELLPHTAAIADELCFVKSLHTDAINHGPAVTFMQTGSQLPGRPSMGSWLHYGLGTGNADLPAFVVLVSKDQGGQPLVSRLWGNGFLPPQHQGVRFRSGADPVLYLNNPPGIDAAARRGMHDALADLHRLQPDFAADPLLTTRIANYEQAYRMQSAVPEATDLAGEPPSTFAAYGDAARDPGTFAANCVLARRLAERGVRFIQLYHQGWDQHGGLPGGIRNQCRETDQPAAALVADLKRRGLLEDTLVIWSGEFGRTNYCQGKLGKAFGRDHHPRCFTAWLAGGGVRAGHTHGATDDYGYNVAADPVHVHDLHATILHCLGLDHERLTYRFQGRRFRLTDVHGEVVRGLLS